MGKEKYVDQKDQDHTIIKGADTRGEMNHKSSGYLGEKRQTRDNLKQKYQPHTLSTERTICRTTIRTKSCHR